MFGFVLSFFFFFFWFFATAKNRLILPWPCSLDHRRVTMRHGVLSSWYKNESNHILSVIDVCRTHEANLMRRIVHGWICIMPLAFADSCLTRLEGCWKAAVLLVVSPVNPNRTVLRWKFNGWHYIYRNGLFYRWIEYLIRFCCCRSCILQSVCVWGRGGRAAHVCVLLFVFLCVCVCVSVHSGIICS